MGDPVMNCLLEVCCGAADAEALYARRLVDKGVCKEDMAKKVAADLFAEFELAPRGSLTKFKADIADVARS